MPRITIDNMKDWPPEKFEAALREAGDRLIFRYDNAPHHPKLPTFPHHKHIDDRVEPCQEPDFQDVLREVNARLYSQPAHS